jgi:hypothetical protein
MKNSGLTLLFITACLTFCGPATAQISAEVTGANQAVLFDDGLGVEMKFDADGRLLSLTSTEYHPVDIPDRRGISKAYVIAEERAKANIVRFQSQLSSSTRIINELDNSQSQTSRTRGDAGQSWSVENSRLVTETLQEITSSSAAGMLRGVKILERVYDESSEEVKVVVGINQQSQQAAQQLDRGLIPEENNSDTGSASGRTDFPSLPSERRAARDAEDF